jgi:hypothetical protein
MLFSDRSIWTMVHGIVLGGAALMSLSAALFSLYAMRGSNESDAAATHASVAVAGLSVFTAAVLWLAVISGTYIVFPPYRVTPPPGTTELAAYPRALVLASPNTAWLHAFGMEIKEHAPWIAAMLATSVAFVAVRYRPTLLHDPKLRSMAATLLAVSLVLVAFVSLMGIFINKVAPLE